MRGKKSHKGGTRHYTSPEEIDRQLGRAHAASASRHRNKAEPETVDDAPGRENEEEESGSSGEEDESQDTRHKGVSHLIEVHNPNHVAGKKGQIAQESNLSKKEIEALAKASTDPLRLKSEAELASDMARLAMVRKQREQAAQLREQERLARESQRQAAEQRAQAKLQALRDQRGGGGRSSNKRRGGTNTEVGDTGSSSRSITEAVTSTIVP